MVGDLFDNAGFPLDGFTIGSNTAGIALNSGLINTLNLAQITTSLGFIDFSSDRILVGQPFQTYVDSTQCAFGSFTAPATDFTGYANLQVAPGTVTDGTADGTQPSRWLLTTHLGVTPVGDNPTSGSLLDPVVISPINGDIVQVDFIGLTEGTEYTLALQHNDQGGDINAGIAVVLGASLAEAEIHPLVIDDLNSRYGTGGSGAVHLGDLVDVEADAESITEPMDPVNVNNSTLITQSDAGRGIRIRVGDTEFLRLSE